MAGTALAAAAFFAAGFVSAAFLAAGFLTAGCFKDAFFARGFAALRGLRDLRDLRGLASFFPGAGPAAFFAGFAADLRAGCAEPRAFAPCFALLLDLFVVLATTHCLLATALRSGFNSYFNVAR
ncbi:MAG: hypothetical protein ABI689_09820 [Thermoanaerobaculia bacterium]